MSKRDKILCAVVAVAAIFLLAPCLFPPTPNLADPTLPVLCAFALVVAVAMFLLWPGAK